MDQITFTPDTAGNVTPKITISTTDTSKKALLTALYNEADSRGVEVILKTVEYENTASPFIKSITLGLGTDATLTDQTADLVSTSFFQAGRIYQYLIFKNTTTNSVDINAGITVSGTELVSAQTVGALTTVAVLISYTPTAVTPLYVWSADWNSASLDISTVSTAV